MTRYLYILSIWLFAGLWTSCSKEKGGEDDPKVTNAPEVSIQNLGMKNTVLPGRSVRLKANIRKGEKVTLRWDVDGREVSKDTILDFSAKEVGTYLLKVTATNELGEASDTASVKVMEGFKISDIQNWTGKGANESVLAIQWVAPGTEDLLHPTDEEVTFLAWGYRWDGEGATGIDMLKAVAKADGRLYLILARDALGQTVKGIGFDANGDGVLKIESEEYRSGHGVQTSLHLSQADFNSDNIYYQKEGESVENVKVLSDGDLWIGGWYTAYATYWLGEGEAILEAEEYEYSNFYASGRLLENQSWDVWTFSPINYETEENILPIPRLLKAADNR